MLTDRSATSLLIHDARWVCDFTATSYECCSLLISPSLPCAAPFAALRCVSFRYEQLQFVPFL